MKKRIFPLIASLIFLVISLITLKDYFISWDEPIHFERGQAYLHYFLTGKLTYTDLPYQSLQGTMGDPKLINKPRRSLYQSDLHNGEYFIQNDSGHPPLNGVLAAFSNYVFFQKFGIVSDVESYHVFNIISSTLLVYVVTSFSLEFFGFMPSIFSFLALITYPLFFSESHFNIKDPVETAFFSATIFYFWKFWKTKKAIYSIPSFIFLLLAFGTKFNAFFIPIIFIIYLILRYGKNIFSKTNFSEFIKNNLILLLTGLILCFILFVLSWPFLRIDPITNLYKILFYYKEIATGFNYQPKNFYILGINTFPTQWILYTTPPLLIIFTAVGIFFSFKKNKEYSYFPLFLLIWLFVPILRVSIPGLTIYGGIRQIFEFLPALILISSLGFKEVQTIISKKIDKRFSYIILFIFSLQIVQIIKFHPNQNLYFNFLIGGLGGAYERNFPSWGNSFGNVYQYGIDWINNNSEKNSKFSLLQNVYSNIPSEFLRSDIDFRNENWSGINREEEYLMEMIFNDTGKSYQYAWDYVDTFLLPVYEYRIDGVTLLKVWKNNLENTIPEKRFKESFLTNIKVNLNKNLALIDLKELNTLSRLRFEYKENKGCTPLKNTFVELSQDGSNWNRLKDWIPFPQVGYVSNVQNGFVDYYIAGNKAKLIRLVFDDNMSCGLSIKDVKVGVLK